MTLVLLIYNWDVLFCRQSQPKPSLPTGLGGGAYWMQSEVRLTGCGKKENVDALICYNFTAIYW